MFARSPAVSIFLSRVTRTGLSSVYLLAGSQKHTTSQAFHTKLTDSAQIIAKNVDPKFETCNLAHNSKSTYDISRALLVFWFLSFESLVQNNQQIMKTCRSVLGRRLFQKLMNHSFYGHFIAGSSEMSVKPVIASNLSQGVNTMLYWAAEEDKNQNDESVSSVDKYERNAVKFKESVNAVSEATAGTGFIAVKPTALCPPPILLKLTSLMNAHSSTQFYTLTDVINSCDTISELTLSEEERRLAESMIERVSSVIQYAADNHTGVMMDAEQTYFQSAINNLLGVQMMQKFNKEKVVVCNTYQCYLKVSYERILRDLQYIREQSCKFSARLVRGAYLTQERELAIESQSEDPTNPNFEATTEMYHKVADALIEAINCCPQGDIEVMFATHNEDTLSHLLMMLIEKDLPMETFAFGQLYGMCDHISFHLGLAGFPVYKSMPYGPIDLVLPYLGRRAVENRGVLDKIKKERRLLYAELKSRLLGGKTLH